MKKWHKGFIIVVTWLVTASCGDISTCKVSLLVAGGGASGTAAGIQAARMGCATLIIEETPWLGGMLTAAGVSAADGNYNLPGGIWGEFKDSLTQYYGGPKALKTGWVSGVLFEPSVGNTFFQKMAAAEENLDVWFETRLLAIEKRQGT
ncbi:MAG: FAD-dependent oxidoreductase, partial [Prevotellaceae bacterium]|nr:FAD-dependent oxidoreductase [Prevotellaceae bacterium]